MASAFRIPLMRPYVTDNVRSRVVAVLDSGHLTEGPVTRALEDAVARFVGCRHAVAVTSCTTGLEIALRALGIGPGDEVIVPSFTYPATASAVLVVGARPVVVDTRAETLTIDPDAAERAISPRTKAIIPVSLFGNPCECDRLRVLSEKHGLLVMEDAAGAIGAAWRGKRVGSLADISVFSLHPRKFITTGEGGLITTDDDRLAERCRSFAHFGMRAEGRSVSPPFETLGTNAKLSDVLSAIGLAQMNEVDALLARRLSLADRYTALLEGVGGVALPVTPVGGTHSRQSFCVRIDRRDEILAWMRERGVEVQIGTYALHRQPVFQQHADLRGPFPGADDAADRVLALPLYHDLSEEDQRTVVALLKEAMVACAG